MACHPLLIIWHAIVDDAASLAIYSLTHPDFGFKENDWEEFSKEFEENFKAKFEDFYEKHQEDIQRMLEDVQEKVNSKFDKEWELMMDELC